MNADDRLSLDPLGRVEGGDGVIEGRDVADVRPHSSVTCPPDNLTQLGAIGYDDEVNRQAGSGPRLGRAGNSHQRSSGSNQACGALRDVAAEDIENQIDFADIFQGVVIEVDELLRAEVESRLTAGSVPGANDGGLLGSRLYSCDPTPFPFLSAPRRRTPPERALKRADWTTATRSL